MELRNAVREQRTYWHLEPHRRIPSDYEITSSQLLYYVGRGFSVRTPVADWYDKFQHGSPLVLSGPEEFEDPLQSTYSSYVARQAERESFVDSLLRSIESTDYDRRLDPDWVERLAHTLPVLRYPCHGMQMVGAYLAQLVPMGRVTILGLFQVGDEMRRIQRFAHRMHQLRKTYPSFGDDSMHAWTDGSAWQPLRRTIERLLVTYDHGEAFVALNLLLKPAFDHVFLSGLGRCADASGDAILEKLLFSLGEDAAWHRSWSAAFIDHVTLRSRGNQTAVCEWIRKWSQPIGEALQALSELDESLSFLSVSIDEALEEIANVGATRRPAQQGAAR